MDTIPLRLRPLRLLANINNGKHLGVNSETLERWIRHHIPARPAFLDITPSVMNMRPAMPVEIGVELNDGARLKLSGASADIAALLIELRQGGGL